MKAHGVVSRNLGFMLLFPKKKNNKKIALHTISVYASALIFLSLSKVADDTIIK